ncbi:MAG: hypothetical protein ABFD66_01100 [Smithella sp.]
MISLPEDTTVYLKLLESQSSKVDNLNELRKFIKTNKKARKEVKYYWEILIIDSYTLVNVEYPGKEPSINLLCNNEIVKLLCPRCGYHPLFLPTWLCRRGEEIARQMKILAVAAFHIQPENIAGIWSSRLSAG